jgi:outer membrane lipoprotein-sorting protein
MRTAFLAFLLFASPSQDPVAAAIERFSAVGSYRVTLHASHDDTTEIIRYSFKKPGFVRMEFIQPHKGAVLVYNPMTKKVRLRPFGFAESLVLTLSPDNRLIRSSSGHRVDASDIGALLSRVKALQARVRTTVSSSGKASGKAALLVDVVCTGEAGQDGICRYMLRLDGESLMPLKVTAYDRQGKVIEDVVMDGMELDIGLDESLFSL